MREAKRRLVSSFGSILVLYVLVSIRSLGCDDNEMEGYVSSCVSLVYPTQSQACLDGSAGSSPSNFPIMHVLCSQLSQSS
jgi:hypothetical protein